MANIRSSGGNVLTAMSSLAQGVRLSAAKTLVAYNFPTEELRTSGATVNTAIAVSNPIRVPGANVLVAARGRVANPNLRAWTYTLDGHDFYVLRLGDDFTFVYDLTTKQWSRFTGSTLEFWRANIGMNWRDAASLAYDYGSSVVVGDDSYGLLWFLDPKQGYDDAPREGDEAQVRFPRVATGQIIARSRQYVPIFEVFLTGSNGWPALTGATVDLKYSDDAGNNYVSAGPQEVEAGNYTQKLSWMSLGRFSYPGRLFRIEDDGALARIDGLDVNHGTATA